MWGASHCEYLQTVHCDWRAAGCRRRHERRGDAGPTDRLGCSGRGSAAAARAKHWVSRTTHGAVGAIGSACAVSAMASRAIEASPLRGIIDAAYDEITWLETEFHNSRRIFQPVPCPRRRRCVCGVCHPTRRISPRAGAMASCRHRASGVATSFWTAPWTSKRGMRWPA
jgi:hypothetical protein